jgi:pyruvate dehydrogenase E1 component beta subunit
MLFNPAKSFVSRIAGHAVRKPISSVPRVTAFPAALRIQQQQRGMASAGTKDYTVRDALNEALGRFPFLTIQKSLKDRYR